MAMAACKMAVIRQPIHFRNIAKELNTSRFRDKCCSNRERNYN